VCIFRKLYLRDSESSGYQKDEFAHVLHSSDQFGCLLEQGASYGRIERDQRSGKVLRIPNSLGLSGPYLSPGPLPMNDHCGYEVALQMVASSLEPGRYAESHKQWDTVGKLHYKLLKSGEGISSG
jgi:hypothetical protein